MINKKKKANIGHIHDFKEMLPTRANPISFVVSFCLPKANQYQPRIRLVSRYGRITIFCDVADLES